MRKIIIAFIVVLTLTGCGQFSDIEMQKIVSKGDVVVAAIKSYYQDKDEYPNSLDQLIPSYLKDIPKLEETSSGFYYMKIPDKHADEYYYGFKLAVFGHKGFIVIGSREAKRLVYYPSEKYPQRTFEKTHKIVGGWAYQTVYRNYDKPNTIIN